MRHNLFARRIGEIIASVYVMYVGNLTGRAQSISLEPSHDNPGIWQDEVGSGFKKDVVEAGAWFGVGFGNTALGSLEAHDLLLSSVRMGWMFTDAVAPGKWYCGNGELLLELLGGAQVHPDTRYLAGFTPLIRYNLATGSPWVPFITCGAGIVFTDIGHPDLSGTFQFDPQGGVGTHYFFGKNVAATMETRWMHISNAGIQTPNHGVNTLLFQAGISWFF